MFITVSGGSGDIFIRADRIQGIAPVPENSEGQLTGLNTFIETFPGARESDQGWFCKETAEEVLFRVNEVIGR